MDKQSKVVYDMGGGNQYCEQKNTTLSHINGGVKNRWDGSVKIG